VDEPTFSVRDRGLFGQRRYWRGPTWINTAWLCWLGLVRLGYESEAAEMAQRLGATVAGAGLREYYEPSTGAGMGALDFGWSSLVMDMIEPDLSGAASSHLDS
jgi:glycogen debranching enzyme